MSQKPHDKTGLGFKEFLSPSTSNSTISPKEKYEHTQSSNITYQNNKNAQINKRSQNHAFRYKYDYRRNKNHYNYHTNNTNIVNPHCPNKIYFKGSNGWFYELKSQNISQKWTQRNESERVAPRHYNGSNTRGNKNKFSNNSKKRAQELNTTIILISFKVVVKNH
jgi:hypothetical protein